MSVPARRRTERSHRAPQMVGRADGAEQPPTGRLEHIVRSLDTRATGKL